MLKYDGTTAYLIFCSVHRFDHGKAQRYVDGEKRRPSKMQARIGLEDDNCRSTSVETVSVIVMRLLSTG